MVSVAVVVDEVDAAEPPPEPLAPWAAPEAEALAVDFESVDPEGAEPLVPVTGSDVPFSK